MTCARWSTPCCRRSRVEQGGDERVEQEGAVALPRPTAFEHEQLKELERVVGPQQVAGRRRRNPQLASGVEVARELGHRLELLTAQLPPHRIRIVVRRGRVT